MDIDNLPNGLYYDPIHGVIEDFRETGDQPEAIVSNTFIMYHEVSYGIVDHAYVCDGQKYQFLVVLRAQDGNANHRFADVYTADPGATIFPPTPDPRFDRFEPTLKGDFIDAEVVGSNLMLTCTDHAPREAPRDSNVEGKVYANVCHPFVGVPGPPGPQGPAGPPGPAYVPPPEPRGGVCVPPNNRPYFRENNKLTRGQVTKMIVTALEATGFAFPPIEDGQQSFEDIPKTSTFYEYIEKLHSVEAVGGYACTPSTPQRSRYQWI